MSVFIGITYDSNDPLRCGENSGSGSGSDSGSGFGSKVDAYFFDFMNCFR
jgi:hypothetical protein